MDDTQNVNTGANAVTPEIKEKTRTRRFIGSYNHSLDSKGRLVIPQVFREKLGETFCIAPSLDFTSVAIYPTEKWEERAEEYEKRDSLDPEVEEYKEMFYALSYEEQTCDAQGRVLLPANIRQKLLEDERDMEITGANDHVRIAGVSASNEKWNKFRKDLPEMLRSIASKGRQSE